MSTYRERLAAGYYSTAVEEEDELTIDDLKGMLRERDLPVTGSKAELQARLDEANDED